MKTILVVEDDTMFTDILRHVLTKAGYNVVTAKDGLEGLDAVRGHHPDLIILDIMMPKLDGLEMLKQLRNQEEPDKKARVIMLSSVEQPDSKIQAFASQVDDYLVKSNVDTKIVLEKVKKVLHD
ncbi:MAG: hypothetical protein A3K08_02950 [Candidatus Doudnabacteria bacterium RIFCSPLOWO2_01_41_7]|nr:MAG: hypothetical protein A3K07_01300 [Candidatus Doudnabacteria bacterium RIFCSPHIGHO2_01_43_10]OGE93392.1 MAG: hypothetical protein A3K08_02950 [Candidatus Doudnabacteria bacterium RIFCSPLOWO2_01_41_7]